MKKEFYSTSVKVNEINTDYGYQRPLDESWVRKIIRNYDPAKVNQIILSMRDDGSLWVIDGNHTVNAVRRVEGEKAVLSAKVFIGLTTAEEAEMFFAYNDNKKNMTFNDKLRSKVFSKDPESIKYITLLSEVGIPWEYTNGGRVDKFVAHNTGMRVYKMYGEEAARTAFEVLKATSFTSRYDGKYVDGLAYLFKKATLNKERLIRRINETPREQMTHLAASFSKSLTGGHGASEKAYGQAFAYVYNKGLRGGRIDLSKLL